MSSQDPARVCSLLELLHPDGAVGRTLVLGSGLSAVGGGSTKIDDSGRPPDLVLVAPDRRQEASGRWTQETATAAGAVGTDGVVYVLARPRARRRLTSQLLRQGLEPEGAFLHIPSALEPRFLVSLGRRSLRFATGEVVPLGPRGRRLAALIRLLPTLSPLELAGTPVGTVLRPPGARRLLAWAALQAAAEPLQAIVIKGERAQRTTLLLFTKSSGEPEAVVKLMRAEAETRSLAAQLETFGPAAEAAGAAIPQVVRIGVGGRAALVESFVPGRAAYAFLLDRPDRVEKVLEPLVAWIGAWNSSTAQATTVTRELLHRHVWSPFELLEQRLRDGKSARTVLERACRAADGEPCPLVASHGDLTMSNVLLSPRGVGVVDWEHAQPGSLPLTDFFYAAGDAAAAPGGYSDRTAAIRASFEPDGRHAALVGNLRTRLAAAVGVSRPVEHLSFLACWLKHAANEARAEAGLHRPFQELLEWALYDWTRAEPAT